MDALKKLKIYLFDNEYIAIIKDGANAGKTQICRKKTSIIATLNALIPKKEGYIYYYNEIINQIDFNKYIVGSGIPHIYYKEYSKETVKIHHSSEIKNII